MIGGPMVKEDIKKKMSKEEEHFYNLNKQLIERKRKELDAKRAEQKKAELKATHWMRCPKCGHQMEEVNHMGIMVDRCTDCSGMYFDKGELELLLQVKPEGFLEGLKEEFFI
jgi:uncharacterized protein